MQLPWQEFFRANRIKHPFPNRKNIMIEEMQAYYGKRAPEYDTSMGYDDPCAVERLAPVISALREMTENRKILELACGPCFWTQQVAATALSIRATDFNESTLEQARKKNLPWDKVSLQQADAYDLTTVPGEFDMVFAVDWLAHVPRSRIHPFLSGIINRLPAGSPVVFIDQLAGAHSWSGVFDGEGNHIQERTLEGGQTFRVIKHFWTDEEISQIFSPFASELAVTRFPECRRILVSLRSKRAQEFNHGLRG